MVDFNADDVKKVAIAIVDDWLRFDENGRNAYYYCSHCGVSVNQYRNQPEDIKHNSDCVVLIAKDLLTGL